MNQILFFCVVFGFVQFLMLSTIGMSIEAHPTLITNKRIDLIMQLSRPRLGSGCQNPCHSIAENFNEFTGGGKTIGKTQNIPNQAEKPHKPSEAWIQGAWSQDTCYINSLFPKRNWNEQKWKKTTFLKFLNVCSAFREKSEKRRK